MNKYYAKKTVVGGITFDSKAEARRYQQLKLAEQAGYITDLKLQVPFEICPSVELDGKKQRPVRYIADFTYVDRAGAYVVEDCKGFITQDYRNKRKLVKHNFGIEIVEVE